MPTYCYKHDDGRIVERVYRMDEVPETIQEDGVTLTRCRPAEYAAQGGTQCATWPVTSMALAVHPTQRGEYSEFARKHGVPTEFDSRGRPVFRTREHRRNYCRLVGAVDYDGGYGDP